MLRIQKSRKTASWALKTQIFFWPAGACHRGHDRTPEDAKCDLPKNTSLSCTFWEPDPKQERQTAEVEFDPKQRWPLERDLDRDTRKVCEAT